MEILLGTGNKGKAIEMASALAPLAPDIVTPADLGIEGSPPEDFETLEENARSKVLFYFERSGGIPTLAEDTGLYVDAISGELGVKTRRWGAGPDATDDEWLAHFLARMERERNRNAKFVAVLAYADASGNVRAFESEASGTILPEPAAASLPGLPVSSVFLPDGYDRVFSALTHEEKNALSHRGKAIKQFVAYIQRIDPKGSPKF
jgi:XTP/dITP diphosphohydrolase